jgi:hypothetical protein
MFSVIQVPKNLNLDLQALPLFLNVTCGLDGSLNCLDWNETAVVLSGLFIKGLLSRLNVRFCHARCRLHLAEMNFMKRQW